MSTMSPTDIDTMNLGINQFSWYFGNGLSGLLRGMGLPLGVTLSGDDGGSCYGHGGSLYP